MGWNYHSQQISRGSTGFDPTPQAHILYYIKTRLKAIGWTCTRSGDGLTYFASSDGITHDRTGAGGFGNANAWARLQQPPGGTAPFSGTRQIVLQNASPLVAYYSKGSGFTTGGSATVRSTASDQQDMTNGGFTPPSTHARMGLHFIGDNNGDFGFSWAVMFYAGPEGAADSSKVNAIYMDAMKSGSFPYGTVGSQDNDPFVFRLDGSSLLSGLRGWRRNGLSSSSWKTDLQALGLKVYPNAFPYLPSYAQRDVKHFTTGLYPTLPVIYAASDGWKGVSSLFKATAFSALGLFPLRDKLNTSYIGLGNAVGPVIIAPWDSALRIYA